jgi:hypothetical protein
MGRSPVVLARPLPNGGRVKRALEPVLTALAVACLFGALLSPYRHGGVLRVLDAELANSDFGAFYCAAAVARGGGDPYAFDPLRTCETARVYGPSGTSYASHGIDPAPLPAYDLALFAPFTYLPYRVAAVLWTGLLVAATLWGAALLTRLTSIPFWLVLAAFAYTNGIACFAYGQVEPLLILALAGAATLLRTGRPALAGLAASATWLEPHVGLAVVLALLIWRSAARAPILVAGATLAVLGLAFCGPAINLEYFRAVLPAHAFAEITLNFQYSLTSLLYTLGLPGTTALRIASLQYAAFVALGAGLAGSLGRRLGTPALLFFPAACAVTGGPYIHIQQIAGALPLGLYLAGQVAPVAGWAWLGTLLVALPWPAYGASVPLFLSDALLVGGGLFAALPGRAPGLRAVAAAAAFALYLVSGPAIRRLPATDLRALDPPASVAAAGLDPRLASAEYAVETRTPGALEESTPQQLAERVPTWAGLLVLLAAACAALGPRADVQTFEVPEPS